MAETAVSSVVDRLVLLLAEEVNLLTGIHKEIAEIKDELESIQSFLKDADVRVEQEDVDSGMKTWVKQVREMAYQIEDVIDEYRLNIASRNDHQYFLYKLACFVKKLMPRHKIASRIQDLKNSLYGLKERSDKYRFSSTDQGGSVKKWHDPRVASLFVEEAELVGIEAPRNELVGRLIEETSNNVVISVVGMGGLGKTTLAKKVYDDQRVMARFDCHAWITVSRSYKMDKVLKTMISQFQCSKKESMLDGIEAMEEESFLIIKLRDYLSEKRYVVVFDDVWNFEFWRYIKYALPDNGKGSRILITTRSEDAAPSKSFFHYVYNLPPLPQDKAMELLHKVCQSDEGRCPPDLLDLSLAIVERCEGLPLAIVTIGGLLATNEKSKSEWQRLLDGLGSALASNQRLADIIKILSFSYHDLPYHLKACFLYFGMFPEYYSISRSTLLRLWIAEGFIKERRGTTVEDVADDYLTELILRNMVQVARFGLNGKAKECRVHDLMREIILSRSQELGFNHVSMTNCSNLKRIGRHVSIYTKANNISSEITSNSQTHSILFFLTDTIPQSLISTVFTNFKLLKVLNFEGTPLKCIPTEVGNLLHLSFLSLRRTNVKMLPKSIGNLCNLETLDLRECNVQYLSVQINKFQKLRNLLAYSFNLDKEPSTFRWLNGLNIRGKVGSLTALQKLHYIEVDQGMDLLRDLERLTQLRKLGIKILKAENVQPLCAALVKMTQLRSLRISSESEDECLQLQPIDSPPPLLKRLYLFGPLPNLPHWIHQLNSLVKIHLYWSRLGEHALQVLQALPNLLQLQLHGGYNGEQLHFRTGCLQKLKVLNLRHLIVPENLIIDQGAFPVLEKLCIGPFPKLKEVPSGIQFLENLKTIQFFDIQRELTLAMLPNGGEDHWKIKHVPAVFFHYTMKGVSHHVYKLGDSDLLKHLDCRV